MAAVCPDQRGASASRRRYGLVAGLGSRLVCARRAHRHRCAGTTFLSGSVLGMAGLPVGADQCHPVWPASVLRSRWSIGSGCWLPSYRRCWRSAGWRARRGCCDIGRRRMLGAARAADASFVSSGLRHLRFAVRLRSARYSDRCSARRLASFAVPVVIIDPCAFSVVLGNGVGSCWRWVDWSWWRVAP